MQWYFNKLYATFDKLGPVLIHRKFGRNQICGLGEDVKIVFFCRAHSAGRVCQISCQPDYRCEGAGFKIFTYLAVSDSATMWQIEIIFYVKH